MKKMSFVSTGDNVKGWRSWESPTDPLEEVRRQLADLRYAGPNGERAGIVGRPAPTMIPMENFFRGAQPKPGSRITVHGLFGEKAVEQYAPVWPCRGQHSVTRGRVRKPKL